MLKLRKFFLLAVLTFVFSMKAFAHPMPHTALLMDIRERTVDAELKIPLKEMQYAVRYDVSQNTSTLIAHYGDSIRDYLLQHIRIKTNDGQDWIIKIGKMDLDSAEQESTGVYNELIVHLTFLPPENTTPRKFILYYDAVLHQLVTHKVLVSVRQDFETGKTGEQETELGVIYVKPSNGSINPLEVNLEEGSPWKGFMSMFHLGMEHIAEGTDHLLFLIVLLLVAPLAANRNKWRDQGTMRYSIVRLLKIVSAFTLGHSLTLAMAAFNLFKLPAQPVEICIAFSILVTAFHAVRPLFPKKEILVAAGFGLIHGLAFAGTISNLNLATDRMVIAVLGFNIGIEIMQLFVVLLVFPWILILSPTSLYRWVRIAGAVIAASAAVSWMAERITAKSNFLSPFVEKAAANGKYFVLALAVIAIGNSLILRLSKRKSSRNNF